jgi:hypothetical protein
LLGGQSGFQDDHAPGLDRRRTADVHDYHNLERAERRAETPSIGRKRKLLEDALAAVTGDRALNYARRKIISDASPDCGMAG